MLVVLRHSLSNNLREIKIVLEISIAFIFIVFFWVCIFYNSKIQNFPLMLSNNLHQIKIKLETCITFTFICSFNNDKQEIKKQYICGKGFSFVYVNLYRMIHKKRAEL